MDDEATAQPALTEEDAKLVAALRAGDEQAFAALVDRYHSSMVRVAAAYVASKEAAEDVVQDAWIGVVQGIERFEGRSSLKTWIFRIVINKAMTRGGREARSVPFSSLGADDPVLDPSMFRDTGRWAGWWASPPTANDLPEERLLSRESRAKIDAVVATLPPSQRLVITLRDIQGLSGPEACELLGITEANQRVLLHRARARLRNALTDYLADRVTVTP